MPKSLKIYLFFLVLIFIGIIWADATKERPINWRESYSLNEKIPFGLYVFNQEHKAFFKPQIVEKFSQSPYEFLDKKYNTIDSIYDTNGTVLLIENKSEIDEYSENELFYFASHGNTIFYSNSNFSQKFKDSLGFEIDYSNNFTDSLQFRLNQKTANFHFYKGINNAYFSKIDSTKTEILGTQLNSEGEEFPNFIKVQHVNGNFYLHLQPVAFTNFNLLNKNKAYTEQILNFIPSKSPIYWKVKQYDNQELINSPLRYILSQPALKWAWFLAWITFIIFMIFNAKRRQRIIPIVEPLKNTTVDFTKTIGNLYFQEKDHQNIADKKIIFFLEKIRNEYYIDTYNLDETFINRVNQKTGRPKKDIEDVVFIIKKIRNQSNTTEKELVTFNELLEKLNL